jgi:hypothetical protein
MALDFPGMPTVGQKYPATPVGGVPTYTWDGEKWTTVSSPIIGKSIIYNDGTVPMAAALTLSGDPSAANDAARKSYVDAKTAAASAGEYIANAIPTKVLTSGAVWTAALAAANLVDAAVVTPDFNAGLDFIWVLGAAGRTLANPINAKGGQKGLIFLYQGVAGSTITTWGSVWKFPGGTKPTLATAGGSFDVLSYVVYPNNPAFIFCAFNGNLL